MKTLHNPPRRTLILQSNVNISVYKNFGLVIPRGNKRLRSVYQNYKMTPRFSGQTPMKAFHSTKNSENFCKSPQIRVAEFPKSQPSNRKFREEVKWNANSRYDISENVGIFSWKFRKMLQHSSVEISGYTNRTRHRMESALYLFGGAFFVLKSLFGIDRQKS